ncbi:hypothetical protein BJI67_07325 [Acidihalobacter aeolianus]|uniref:Uncharacterized protein n=2 Tax=Acidihalobacter aeolianus TaxID=2792603 RepID=A0A1D8K7I4_9GAMM|nr:hypothetical protein BJI67_07325 [Acidihalobacter aeolianus]
MFQPTRRPIYIQREITTPWGLVRIVGRLGQAHADVFEALFYSAEDYGPLLDEDGGERIKLLVDPAKVRRLTRQDGTGLKTMLDELTTALIEIKEPEHLRCIGHLIDHIGLAARQDGSYVTKPNPMGGERHLLRIEIGKAAVHLLRHDMGLWRDPSPIAKMRRGISQSVARLMLTHSPTKQPTGGFRLDKVLEQVCGPLAQQEARNRRRELRADADNLAAIGIVICGDRIICYRREERKRIQTGSLSMNHEASV